MVKADQTVSVRPLTVGPAADEQVVVLAGLQPDEMVVVDGADKLREGMKVKLITRESATSSGEAPSLPSNKIHQDKNQ